MARCVGDVDEFLAGSFGIGPHLHDGGGFADLLALADVDAQLAGGGLRRPAIRLVRDGEPIDPAGWTRPARTGAHRFDDLVHPGRVLAEFDAGATVVLQSLQRWWPPLGRFCRDLETVLGHAVQANAYLTPPRAAGLSPHHDTHDVFVLQVHGAKRWVVREPIVEAPLARHRSDHDAAARQPVVLETELAPGRCLYLPRGFVHSAATQDGVSLHLTVGVLATTAHDVVRALVDRAAEEPRFRRTLPPAWSRDVDVSAGVVKDVVAELLAWLGRLDVDDVAGALVARAARRRLPPAEGHLLSLAALGELDDRRLVVAPSGLSVRTTVEGDRLRLATGDCELRLPAALADAVALLLDGEPHAPAELAGRLDEGSRAVLVRRLVREGLLRIVDGG